VLNFNISNLPKIIINLFFVSAIFFVFSGNANAISNKVNYQAHITDKQNTAISGNVSIKFSIYTALSGGTALWSETKIVQATNGNISTVLGDTNPLTLDFNEGSYYLGIKIADDSEMSPRKSIGSAPFSQNSAKLNGKSAGTGANNVLELDGDGNIDIAGNIETAGSLIGNTSTLGSLTVSGTSIFNGSLSVGSSATVNVGGTFQLGGTTILASAQELNYVDGVTSSIQDQLNNRMLLSGGAISGNITFTGSQTVDGIDISTIPSTYLALGGGTMSGAISLGNSNITNVAQLALTPRTDGTATEGYVYYDSDTDAFYGRTASDWVNFAGDGGDVTSVTAGDGLAGGGLSGDLTLNVVSADETIIVNANSIQVGTIGSSNITDGSITAADLGADSVGASALSSSAIVFGDIEAGDLPAAIDSAKIAGGTVDNTEFGYLNGVTSSIQSQFSNYLPLAGGTISGNLAFSGAQTVDGVDISDISSTYLSLSGGTLTGNILTNPVGTSNLGSTTAEWGNIYLSDDKVTSFGADQDANLIWETADANANHLNAVLPEGTATNVPVFVIGDATINNADLGMFNGLTDPSLAIISNDGGDYIRLSTYDNGDALINVGTGDLLIAPSGHNVSPAVSGTESLGASDKTWLSGYFGSLLTGAGDALTITANNSSTWSTSNGALTIIGNDGLNLNSTDGGGININPVGGMDLNVNINGNSQMYIGGNGLNELRALYLDADLAAGTALNSGFELYYQPDGAGVAGWYNAQRIFLEGTNIGAEDDYTGLAINVSAGSNAPDNFIELTNTDGAGTVGQAIDIWAASGGDITDGVLFSGISGSGNITDAIDASYSNITNAINVGDNVILGTTATINFTNFDVTGAGAMTLTGKITNTNYTGSSSVDNGNVAKTVNTTYVSTGDKIFVSFTANPGGYWWVSNIVNGTSFDVNTSAACGQLGGCSFDYWIVK